MSGTNIFDDANEGYFEVEMLLNLRNAIVNDDFDSEMDIEESFELDPLNQSDDETEHDTSTPLSSDSPPNTFMYGAALTAFLKQLDDIPAGQSLYNGNGQILLTAEDVHQIKNFIKSRAKHMNTLQPIDLAKIRTGIEKIYKDYDEGRMTLREVHQELLNLWKPYTWRISYKDQIALPRTIDITFDHDMKLRFMIHTNKKVVVPTINADQTSLPVLGATIKDPAANLGKGSSKVAKSITNIVNSTIEPIARLQTELTTPNQLLSLVKEMQFAQSHRDSKYIDCPFMGSIYQHMNKNGQISINAYVYSKKAVCSLEQIEDIETNMNSPNYGKPKFISEQELQDIREARANGRLSYIYWNLLLDALNGLQEIHAAGQIHRDIKPDNIFIYRDPYGNLHAKISDPGLATTMVEKSFPLASFEFASPQVFYAHTTQMHKKYFFDTHAKNLCVGKTAFEYLQKNSPGFVAADNIADPADDIYALGVSLLEKFLGHSIFTKDTPTARDALLERQQFFAANYPRFMAMMNPDRALRPTASELIRIMNEVMNQSVKNPHN